jgi:hypothetical protein
MCRRPGRQQRQQRVRVGGQIDIQVTQDGRVAARPDGPQRPAPAGPVQPDRADQFQIGFEGQGFRPGAVGAAVVRDRDAGAEREAVVQVGVQPPDAAGQAALLIPDRDN